MLSQARWLLLGTNPTEPRYWSAKTDIAMRPVGHGRWPPTKRQQLMSLLKWALIFFLISIVAAIFGFGGVAAASADIARVLFYIFVVIFLVLLILGLLAARRV
jgi:uncharacterized membrane protein YtjA (UPF0391 family)